MTARLSGHSARRLRLGANAMSMPTNKMVAVAIPIDIERQTVRCAIEVMNTISDD
jgi:hypothetical protein